MAPDRPRPEIRLGDADREHAASRVAAAHADGRISLDELDERLSVIYGARTAGDLEPAVGDLPSERERRLLAGADPASRDRDVVDLRPRSNGVVGEGRWEVPRRSRVNLLDQARVEIGTMSLVVDLRTAVIPYPEVEIGLWTIGAAQLVLPPGGTVDSSRVHAPGRPARTSVPSRPAPPAVHVVVYGVLARRRALRIGYGRLPSWWVTMTA